MKRTFFFKFKTKKNTSNKPSTTAIQLLMVCCLLFLLTWLAIRWLDTDFGWHYRLGELISTEGTPKTDPFSFTMPSYPYIDHEWLLNLLYYRLYDDWGYNALGVVHAVVAVLASFISISTAKNHKKYWLVPFLFLLSTFLLRYGIRPQVFSWLFLAIFTRIVYNRKLWQKTKWVLPILIVVWVNIHGSYLIGIVLTLLFILVKAYEERRVVFSDLIVFFLVLVSVVANPYGIRNPQELISQMVLGEKVRITISEWLPSLFAFDMGFFAIAVFSIVLLVINAKKTNLLEKTIIAGATFAGIKNGRHAPLAVILMVPFLIDYFYFTKMKAQNVAFGKNRFRHFYFLLIIISTTIFLLSIWTNYKSGGTFTEGEFYPKNATIYLEKNNEIKNVFARYTYGGYLIWRAPSKKYFVDGRMDVISWNSPPVNESSHAYKEYLSILCGEQDLYQTIEKYKIDAILVNKEDRTRIEYNEFNMQFKKIFSAVGLLYCDNYISLSDEAKKLNWGIVYEDDKAIIYKRDNQ